MISKLKRYVRRNNGVLPAISNLTSQISKFGISSIAKRITGQGSEMGTDYQYWIENKEAQYNVNDVKRKIQAFTFQPLISVLLPVYNVEEKYLRACIDSVREQYYENWELCIADDASTEERVHQILKEYLELDERIKVVFREKNGHISQATNSALEIASGEYLALLDNDDFLKPEALFEVVCVINDNPLVDMIYTDENKVDETGKKRVWPAFKPDWSPDAFLAQMYIGHLGVYRKSIAESIGGFRDEYVGSQDYDFALRISEKAKVIKHIPKVLYHWRMIPGSTASGAENKDYAFDASFRAKKEALIRRNITAEIVPYVEKHSTILEYSVKSFKKVTLVLSIEDGGALLDEVFANVPLEKIANIVVISSLASWNEVEVKLTSIHQNTIYHGEKLNVIQLLDSNTNNDFLFLESTYVPQTDNWFDLLAGQAQQKHSGVVGARSINHKSYIESAGLVFLFDKQKVAKAFHGFHENDVQVVDRLLFSFNYLAVTNTCAYLTQEKLAIATKWLEENGFSQKNFLDICLALDMQNYYNVYRGDVCVKNYLVDKNQIYLSQHQSFFERWQKYYTYDPYYNRNFSTTKADFTLNLEK